ncbi:hypothetical protein, partial [Aeromonas veronii]|uniref:hypothetical protein n=1 Tax=Aeromonas veronii TaxID=654 RepID=UPI001C6390AB
EMEIQPTSTLPIFILVAAGGHIIGIVKCKSSPSELDCQLTTGVISSSEQSCIGGIGSVKWKFSQQAPCRSSSWWPLAATLSVS